ncbi:hypothetical protein PYW07_014431 [Mythimna separata]|uniref:Carboxylic ester hydrolase n=1 Tax=Mythimna separata TaxID=271217 RepID=A0AAD7Z1Y2_MYTSE|nr:hypothetical protein PYW07_014431 [Mythimna separata]
MKIRSCVVLLCVTALLAEEEWLEINTPQGPVRGRKYPGKELFAFYNIPYATAPTGVHKFKAPLPPPNWTEPYDAVEMNFVCPQNEQILKEFMPEKVLMNENCLVANVFVPRTAEENLSVIVYIHGGAFLIGYGNRNKATQLMIKRDFIMVTFNYRLGVHGFLCLGTEDIPGNAGMKDQVAALRWVKKNIASFGGNPKDVTLAGSSSGAASIELLMLSKMAEGLFHRIIPESGGSLAAYVVQRDPLEIARYHAKKLNFHNTHSLFDLEEFYKKKSLQFLTSISHFNRTDSTFLFSPCVETEIGRGHEPFLSESPIKILEAGKYKKLPMLYGFTRMEGMLRIGYFDIWKHKMYQKFSDFLPADLKFYSEEERMEIARAIKNFYFRNRPVGDDNVLGYIDFFTDLMVAYPILRAVQLHVKAGHKQIYLYEYSYPSEDKVPHTNLRSTDHCAQSRAWLDNYDGKTEIYEDRNYQYIRKLVREIWHNFMKTGKPVPPGSPMPPWPPVGPDRSPHMVIGPGMDLRGKLLERITNFWDKIYQSHYRDAIRSPPLKFRSSSGYIQNKKF